VCETSKLCHALLLKWTVKLLGEDIAAINELRSLTMFPEEASSDTLEMVRLCGVLGTMPNPEDKTGKVRSSTVRMDNLVWITTMVADTTWG
jgi:hypothetical protein